MDQSLLTLVLSSGVASERREACEFLDLKTRVEEEKYRQLSADLERRRIRKYNSHLEEQRKVEKELDQLQKDRLRFEREKQLRKRKSFSASRGRKHTVKSPGKDDRKDDKLTLPLNEDTLGGSASIAFDPKVEKYRRRRRKAKTETFISNSRKAEKEITEATNFPYLSEGEVKKFHKSCKSAAKSVECRRWGAAWLYAKNEQEKAMDKSERWTSLLLNAEKENMRALCKKLISLTERKLPSNVLECWKEHVKSNPVRASLAKPKTKYLHTTEKSTKPGRELETRNLLEDKENVNNKVMTELFEEYDENKQENGLRTTKGQSINLISNYLSSKQQGLVIGNYSLSRKVMVRNELPFVSPFSKGIIEAKKLSFRRQSSSKPATEKKTFSNSSKKREEKESTQWTLIQDVTSQQNESGIHGSVSFLPELFSSRRI